MNIYVKLFLCNLPKIFPDHSDAAFDIVVRVDIFYVLLHFLFYMSAICFLSHSDEESEVQVILWNFHFSLYSKQIKPNERVLWRLGRGNFLISMQKIAKRKTSHKFSSNSAWYLLVLIDII